MKNKNIYENIAKTRVLNSTISNSNSTIIYAENFKPGFFNSIPLWVKIAIFVYIVFSVIFAMFMYKRLKKHFIEKDSLLKEENEVQNTDDNLKVEIDSLENDYPEFRRNDKKYFSFFRVLLGALFFFWIKMITLIVVLILVVVFLLLFSCFRVNNSPTKKTTCFQWVISFTILSIFGFPVFLIFGLISIYKKKRGENIKLIYEKYMGKYDDNNDKSYACIISNHVGWIDIFYWCYKLAPGFIAKKELGNIPIFGQIMSNLNCLLVDRNDKQSRLKASEDLTTRIKMFYDKETYVPILIYPEGTVTNGEYLLPFKPGCFNALLPIKPLFIEIDDFNSPLAYIGFLNMIDHFFYVSCFLYNYTNFYELPIIEYNEFMKKNHQLEGESDVDTYSRVANIIYRECFNLKESKKTYEDVRQFEDKINKY